MKKDRSKSKGQAVVEYIIIIVIVAVAALAVLGIFSDRIRTIIAGAASTFGAEDAESAVDTSSVEIMQTMDADGIDVSEGSN